MQEWDDEYECGKAVWGEFGGDDEDARGFLHRIAGISTTGGGFLASFPCLQFMDGEDARKGRAGGGTERSGGRRVSTFCGTTGGLERRFDGSSMTFSRGKRSAGGGSRWRIQLRSESK